MTPGENTYILLAFLTFSGLPTSGLGWFSPIPAIVLACAAIPAALFAGNFWLFRRPGPPYNKRTIPPVSVLIPARNEERSIQVAIEAVLASRGVGFEVVVLDDGSSDRTAEIVRAIAEQDPRVRLETAPPLAEGWNGKQHACWELAALAQYDVFCFLDADVRVGPEALYRMASELNWVAGKEPERTLVSGFPRQETVTFLERLLLPLIQFVLLGFLPFPGERWTGLSGFAAGCGQFMMVRRDPYFGCGGHSAIRRSMHDGLLLPQLFRRYGMRTQVYDLSRDAACRMYRSGEEVWHGLAKNATEGMAALTRLPVFTVLLLVGQVLPLPLAIWATLEAAGDPYGPFWPAAQQHLLLALALGYGVRAVGAWRYRQSWLGTLLHPVGIAVLLALQWWALIRKLAGKQATWKQRAYQVG